MRTGDAVGYAWGALTGYRLRTSLMLLAMAIGVASVLLLTALGEGARRYVTGEFAALGTHLLVVMPGRNETTGGMPPMAGATPRDLTIADAQALYRSRNVAKVAPLALGEAPVSYGGLERSAIIMGTTAEMQAVRSLELARGRFLPPGPADEAQPVAVIGATLREELFGERDVIGQWLRIGERRFRVIGIVEQRGQSLGADMDEVVLVPVASAQMLFDSPSLFRILIQARERGAVEPAREDVRRILRERHEGEEDVTVITQDSVLGAFDRIFQALTLTVAGIAGISLVVAGILVMNVMLVAVTQRTAEIGLLRALGASSRRILWLFLTEAALLSLLGAGIGLALGWGGAWGLRQAFPALPANPPLWAIAAGFGVAVATGLLFAWLPARRAARLDPVEALSRA